MNYKEKYEQALERASKLRMQNPFDTVGQMVEHIFPELKESEDEKIRKGLIKAVSRIFEGHKLFDTDVTREEALAWLENQGEQTHAKLAQSEVTKKSDQELSDIIKPKKIDADKIIAWLVANICDFEYYVKLFKKDFKL